VLWTEPGYISVGNYSSAIISAVLLVCRILHAETLSITRKAIFQLCSPAELSQSSHRLYGTLQHDSSIVPKYAKKAVNALEFTLVLVHELSVEEFSLLQDNSEDDKEYILQLKGHGLWSQAQTIFSVTKSQLAVAR
jgi:hypothetical protein